MKTLQPPGNNAPKNSQASNNNFARALFEAGGNVAQTAVDNGIKMANEAITSIFNTNTSNPNFDKQKNPNAQMNESFDPMNPTWMNSKESQEKEWKKREAALLRHREVNQVEVFDRRQVETDQKIKQIIEQLDALSKDLDKANSEAQQARIAVIQGVVKPGAYHVSLLQRFLKVVMTIRQRVKESSSWLSQFNSRRSAQTSYWGQFHSQGTQWSMSGERSITTSVG